MKTKTKRIKINLERTKDYIIIATAFIETDLWLKESEPNIEGSYADKNTYKPRVYRARLLNNLTNLLERNNPLFSEDKFYTFINKAVEKLEND